MSRSYHDTRKSAFIALCRGDVEPGYRFNEKHWIKYAAKMARKSEQPKINRAIVAEERRRTLARKERSNAVYIFPYGFVEQRKKAR